MDFDRIAGTDGAIAHSLPAIAPMSRFAFFRQSGWMLIATVLSGICLWAVHLIVPGPLGEDAYGLFNTLVSSLAIASIPALGIQAILAQQTAAIVNESQMRQLRATVRVLLGGAFVLWLVTVVVVFFFQQSIGEKLKIKHFSTVWITVVAALFILCLPVFMGVLQGKQNFGWFGGAGIAGSLGRFLGIFVLVYFLGYGIAWAMAAVLIGFGFSLTFSAWQTRDVWLGPREPVVWREWLARVVPLSLGIGATTLIMNADMILVRVLFEPERTGYYSAAGILGRALAYFAGSMAQVMFPKVVQSAARAERTNIVAQAAGATALLGGIGALVCTIVPWLPLRVIYPPEYLSIEPIVPWFAWCVLPLTLSNVFINNLLARGRYAVVPWLVMVALGYAAALFMLSNRIDIKAEHAAFKTIVLTLGLFGSVVLVVCAWFTWRTTEHGQSRPAKAGAVA
jgi:O-antigen/teichoic acid export membrane protein